MPIRVHVPGCYKAVILNVCLLRDPLLMPLDLGKHSTFRLNHARIQRWGHVVRTPLPEKSQKYRVFSNPGPDKATKLGHHRHASEKVFRWQADDGLYSVIWVLSSKKTQKSCKVGPHLA